MNWQYTTYALLLALTVAISTTLALVATRRSAPGARSFAFLMSAVAIWSCGYVFELGTTDVATKVLWVQTQYFGIVAVPLAWLMFALHDQPRHASLARRWFPRLSIIPLMTLALVWTNQIHHLIWTDIELDPAAPIPALNLRYGPWFWIHSAYSYSLLLAGTIIVLRRLKRSLRRSRLQALALLIGALAPWLGIGVYLLGVAPWPHLDLTPFAFAITGLTFGWSLFRFRLLDVAPVARDAIFESLRDGVIVLDVQQRIVDCNPAAERILRCSAIELVGRNVRSILPDQIALFERSIDGQDARTNLTLGTGHAQRHFDLSISPLRRGWGRLAGQLLVMREITERMRAERALRDSEMRYRAVSELTSDYAYALGINRDKTLVLEWVTDAFVRITGFTGPEVEARGGWTSIIHPDDLPMALQYASDIFHGKTHSAEFRIVTKSGATRWLRHYGRSVWDADEERVVRILGAANDITAFKQTETALRQSEQRYRLLFDRSPIPMWVFDRETLAFLAVNVAAIQHYGYGEDEFLAMTLKDIRPPDEVRRLVCLIAELGDMSDPASLWKHRRKDGSLIDVETTSHPIMFGGRPARVTIAIDTTERLRTEAALRQQNEYLAALHETTLALINRLEVGDVLRAIVVRAAALVGTEHGYIYLAEPSGPDGAVELVVKVGIGVFEPHIGYHMSPGVGVSGTVLRTGQPLAVENYQTWTQRSADVIWDDLHASAGVPLTSGTQVVGVLGLAHVDPGADFDPEAMDILTRFAQLASIALDNARLYTTAQQELIERKRAEEELALARDQALEAARLKSEFLATMSHELRTPLNAIIGFTELTLEQTLGPLNDVQRHNLERVSRNAHNLLDLINNILDMSKVDAGRMMMGDEWVALDDVVEGAVGSIETLIAVREIDLIIQRPAANLPLIRGDAGRLRQIALNLLSNAVKFTPPHGTITLSIEYGRPTMFTAAASPRKSLPPGRWIALSVQDTGIGIPSDEHERIWSEFYQIDGSPTRQYGGTGLGLAIVRRLTLLMRGFVGLRSIPGEGSTFTIWLPVADTGTASAQQSLAVEQGSA